ncbi:type I-F CRISPR-associated helicase Cas3f [Desulfobacter postgatei]|jgi:CRISPR-associated endonuclease/helicase Cas3|uniref:type I-F CRISPR-associated helicase Cas3f n=1 Tax=Desulfobacter postgatei TaxID=2293 RepID=UPI002A360C8C|nr:type I-F CRISPR-associated helicase Cas3f [Desulfobacter postgatei]MDX9964370.1 type I-F CRISPR-associated helicase Cas3f [Desulfobacter postgatei]
MMVTFISQCEKKALARTRRVLDAFADRIGDNTWQTVITMEGLLAVKNLLRKTASKSTAVSCHWIRSRARSEFIWVVGNKHKFDQNGRVPVNTTIVNRPYRDDLDDWHYLPLIQSLACLSALLHDWGKACTRFQDKLRKGYKGPMGDALRHEWLSCVLLKAFINSTQNPQTDNDWLTLLSKGEIDESVLLSMDLEDIKHPLKDLPPIAQLIAWLILTHHRMPLLNDKNKIKNDWPNEPADNIAQLFTYIDEKWGYSNESAKGTRGDCLHFPKGLISNSKLWLKALKRWSGKLIGQQKLVEQILGEADHSYRPILYHARLCLMLADHYYSSLSKEASGSWNNTIDMTANTQKNGSAKQALDQHLLGVYEQAKRNARHLPKFERELPVTENISALKQKSSDAKFTWQDKAARKIRAWVDEHKDRTCGFFTVNMASTGCGKTFANAKVMLALTPNNDSLRYILALGLRTLTLQTGDDYRNRIFQSSDSSDLGVIIGSKAIADLHEDKKNEKAESISEDGAESQQSLMEDTSEIFYDVDIPENELITILPHEKNRKLLYAPILVCTIDHIISATETTRGGRYILPALRLMSSDLVIDEIDDFTGADAIAIGRLIHLAGMLGRKVMISSATIPPSLAEGYFNCYREGWRLYTKTRNAAPQIGCAWIDEFTTVVTDAETANQKIANQQYAQAHKTFIETRIGKLAQQPPLRKADIISCKTAISPETACKTGKQELWFNIIIQSAFEKHPNHHTIDQKTGLKVSFGVIRIANIQPCVSLAMFLLEYDCPQGIALRVMPYHSQQVLLLRHEQEKHLDTVLKRKEDHGEKPAAFNDRVIRAHLDAMAEKEQSVQDVLFILVATPVEEVGRDHDFDWAIVEPSSYRSIVQIAGRVKRHREQQVLQSNVGVLQYNWKTIRSGDKPHARYFTHPGYEFDGNVTVNSKSLKASCSTYDLNKLVNPSSISNSLNAIPRIDDNAKHGSRLASLEHAVTAHWLKNYRLKGPESLQGYITGHWYLTALPQALNRFRQSRASVHLFRCCNSTGETYFTIKDERGYPVFYDTMDDLVNQDDAYNIRTINLSSKAQQRLWLTRNYMQLLIHEAEVREINLNQAALLYGEVVIQPIHDEEESIINYLYNDQLGFFRQEK